MADVAYPVTAGAVETACGGDVADYVALMKPRVMFLVVFTALVGLVAAPGSMHPVLAIAALVCIAVGAGAAGALNMWFDADIDAAMARTASRPIPRGRVSPEEARAAGAVPPMIGWAAATGGVSLEPFILFLIIFVWTPPHFWALALLRADDYARAGVPMLPVVKGADATRLQILIYSLILAPLGMLPALLGFGGVLYAVCSFVLGALFVVFAVACYRERVGEAADRAAKHLFAYSVLYLFLLFAVILVEQGFGIDGGALPLIWAS